MKEVNRGKRFVNHIVDSGLFYLLVRIIFSEPVRAARFSPIYAILIGVAFYLIYQFLSELFFKRTIGKLITKTIVVMKDGDVPTLSSVFIRTISRMIPFNGIVTLITGKSIHERVSKTVCIDCNTKDLEK